MSYRLEWIGGVAVFGIVVLLLIVPELATIAVLVVAFVALVALVALVAVALASPYLLVRTLRRRLARRTIRRRMRWEPSPSTMRSRSADGQASSVGILLDARAARGRRS